MHAMVLTAPGAPLLFQERDDPVPEAGAVRVKIDACGVCRTDLHVVDGELPDICYPIVPGHEVIGVFMRHGEQSPVAGYFFQPPTIARPDQELPPQAGAVTPEMKRLVEDLEQLDKKFVAAKPADQDRLNASKADLLEKIVPLAPQKDQDLWV